MKYFKNCSLFLLGVFFLSFFLAPISIPIDFSGLATRSADFSWFPFNNVFAQTDIYGSEEDGIYHILTDTTWTKDAGPYVIHQNVQVEKGATLTILPGTVLKFDWPYLDVFGKLIAEGTAGEKIYFTSFYDDSVSGDTDGDEGYWIPQSSDWGGIEIIDGGSYEINNAEISYAETALSAYPGNGSFDGVTISNCDYGLFLSGSNIDIKNSDFVDISEDIINAYSRSAVSLASSSIKNVGGYQAVTIYDNSSINIDNSKIEGTSNLFDVISNSSIHIVNTEIKDVQDVFGVYDTSLVDISSSTIEDVGEIFQVFNNNSINVNNSTIENSQGYQTIEMYNGNNFNFSNSTLKNVLGRSAVSFSSCGDSSSSTLNITNSVIDGGADVGLEIFCPVTANIKNTKIQNFLGDAMQVFSNPVVRVSDSEISGNNNGIESWGADVEIKNSSILNNATYGIYNEPSYFDYNSVWVEKLPIKASGNWWGDASGPFNELSNASGTANQVSENVEFTPWLTKKPGEKQECCSNVLFIPGLQASRLYKKGLFFENQLWEPNRNADVEKLYLNSSGESLDLSIYTNDIIKRTNIGMGIFDLNIYKKFSDTMDSLVTEKKINGWETLPYDWRFDINKIVKDGVKMADESTLNFVDELIKNASSSATGKVTIVTHSNGGLIAKALINELRARGKENLVDKLIMVAAPQLGTPEAIVGILHGDDQELLGGWILEESTARTMAENMMGAYNLLPEDAYFSKITEPIIKFNASVDKVDYPTKQVANFRAKYGNAIGSSAELRDFLLGVDGRTEPDNGDTDTPNVLKTALLNLAQTNHSILDSWAPLTNIKVVQLAGWGVNTLAGIEYSGKDTCAVGFQACVPVTILDRSPIYTENGDKTVVVPSAVATDGAEKYYLDIKKYNDDYAKQSTYHANIFEATSTIQFINNFVLNGNNDILKYISTTTPVSTSKTLELSLHSPVSINVYDSAGNHTGLINNLNPSSDLQMVEENIPGSRYDDFGEGKYVLLDESNQYRIMLQGLDVGTFTLDTKVTQGGGTISTSSFIDIPTNPLMMGEVVISTSTVSASPVIKIDIDGDGKNDFTITGSQEFDPIIYLQILRKTVETFDASKKTKDEVIKKIDSIIKSLQKNKTKTAISKIKSFSKELSMKTKERRDGEEKKHKDDKNWKNKKHKLVKADAETLLAMLSQLLDNLIK